MEPCHQKEAIQELREAYHGNGHLGVKTRLALLESWQADMQWYFRRIMATVIVSTISSIGTLVYFIVTTHGMGGNGP